MDLQSYLEKIQYNEEDIEPHEAVSAIIKKGDKILMLDHVKYNFWTIPVGKAKPGQTVVEGLKEELKEEINITPTKFKEVLSFKKIYQRNGRRVPVTNHVFLIESWSGTIRNNEPKKHRSIKFMTLDEIKKLNTESHATQEMLKYFDKMK